MGGGNSTALAAVLQLNAWTCENWRQIGIPTKYWDKLYELYDLTPAELHTVSKRCRETTVMRRGITLQKRRAQGGR